MNSPAFLPREIDTAAGPGRALLAGVPEALEARVIAGLATGGTGSRVLHIARDDARLARLAEGLAFFAPELPVLLLPAWDCLPYDRVSPVSDIVAERVDTMTRLANGDASAECPTVVLTTVSAALQRLPARAVWREASFDAAPGEPIDLDGLTGFLVRNGYRRASTVREPGEFAIRGGIVDLFPPGPDRPVRLDLFGDTLEGIRSFDAGTQRTTGTLDRLALSPISEIALDPPSIGRFRAAYRELFGAVSEDPLYQAVSEGRKQAGMEHWLPLFHETLETVFDYLPDAMVTLENLIDSARDARLEMIADYYDARRTFLESGRAGQDRAPPYRPLPPDRLYLDGGEWDGLLAERRLGYFRPYDAPKDMPRGAFDSVANFGGRRAPAFTGAAAEAEGGEGDVFDRVRRALEARRRQGTRAVIAAWSPGSRERLGQLLAEHGIAGLVPVGNWPEIEALPPDRAGLAVLGIEQGFETPDLLVVGEQDILGERLTRPRRRRAKDFISDASDLSPQDLVVHVEHGIGRYEGLETVVADGAPHDCLRLTYAGGDRLYVPVESLEVMSRYGSGESDAALDRLGTAAWQQRKARLKKRLLEMADALIAVAAARKLHAAEPVAAEPGLYEAFCARFPFTETDDQVEAIEATLEDLGRGQPMDRLICGDVGFGKTEVALRAAFNVVHAGGQVAVVVPTTLLSRQHFVTFTQRFAGLAVNIGQLSRLVSAREAAATRKGLADGTVDIAIGTHALLAKNIAFRNLALLVIDEEQHFGVAHKERLKQLKANVHVLTMTATPIPRTLQMALSGVREMSTIATPPVDRLAVRTYVLPFDPVIVREAIMRERFRGGQSFYVCPRISQLDEVAERLEALVPDVTIRIAHGRMPTRALEDVMVAFYEGKIDVLLSTQIIESGLDIPRANTLIVHRADQFGLAQLYQLRGRIGRSKLRGYCYLTLPPDRVLTDAAEKRLDVMRTLDTLGAGFSLASHDLDIRGAGNLLGDAQSGHIREVGVELYQQMLEEAVAEARGTTDAVSTDWVPQIAVGLPVLIPTDYVSDLDVRLGLYRRIARLADRSETDSFAAEMIDRFGPLPEEVETLLHVVAVKQQSRRAGIDKLDAGPKGAVIAFRDDAFANPAGLIRYIQDDLGRTRLRPDHRLVVSRDWVPPARRLDGVRELVDTLAAIAEEEA